MSSNLRRRPFLPRLGRSLVVFVVAELKSGAAEGGILSLLVARVQPLAQMSFAPSEITEEFLKERKRVNMMIVQTM